MAMFNDFEEGKHKEINFLMESNKPFVNNYTIVNETTQSLTSEQGLLPRQIAESCFLVIEKAIVLDFMIVVSGGRRVLSRTQVVGHGHPWINHLDYVHTLVKQTLLFPL